jgi:DNA-binding transcriptional regulator YiaG
MAKKKTVIDLLNKWLKKPNGSTVEIAIAMGFKSSNTIYNWRYRKEVPKHMEERVLKFLKEKGETCNGN